jgi:hypothetical protein
VRFDSSNAAGWSVPWMVDSEETMTLQRLVLLVVVFGTLGCIERVSVEQRPCPCEPGWQCCQGVCIQAAAVCAVEDAGSQTDVLVRDGAAVYPDGGLPYRACTQLPPTQPTGSTVAVWTGYLDNAVAGGGDEVTMTLMEDGSGAQTGTVVFGSGAPPPAPTSSEECYPAPIGEWQDISPMERGPIAGYVYPISWSMDSTIRLQAAFPWNVPWTDWCACQVPVEVVPGTNYGWSCLPNVRITQPAGSATCSIEDESAGALDGAAFPCCKMTLCTHSPVCTCSETACAVIAGDSANLSLDVNGDRADGNAPWGQGGGIHLARSQ